MRDLWVSGFACLSLLSAPAFGQTQAEALLAVDPIAAKPFTDIAPLAWLAGCWINPRYGRMVWQAPKDGIMKATAIPPLGPGQIMMNGQGLALFRPPNGGFPAVAIAGDKAVFFIRQRAHAPRDGALVLDGEQGPEIYGMTVSFERRGEELVLRQSSSGTDVIDLGPGDHYRRCTVAEASR